jgi:hypothetical protein
LDTCLDSECWQSHLSHHREGKAFISFQWNGWLCWFQIDRIFLISDCLNRVFQQFTDIWSVLAAVIFFNCDTLAVCAVPWSRLAGDFYLNVLSTSCLLPGYQFEGLLIRNLSLRFTNWLTQIVSYSSTSSASSSFLSAVLTPDNWNQGPANSVLHHQDHRLHLQPCPPPTPPTPSQPRCPPWRLPQSPPVTAGALEPRRRRECRARSRAAGG